MDISIESDERWEEGSGERCAVTEGMIKKKGRGVVPIRVEADFIHEKDKIK
jgi:hypothetical protein